jgi:hypothetical protein
VKPYESIAYKNMSNDNTTTNYLPDIQSSSSYDTVNRLPVVVEDKPIDFLSHHDDGMLLSSVTVVSGEGMLSKTPTVTTTTVTTPPTPSNTVNSNIAQRPKTISNNNARLMSVDSTSIDFDAIEMTANRVNHSRTQSEIDDNNNNNNNNNSTSMSTLFNHNSKNSYYNNNNRKATTTTATVVSGSTSTATSSTKYLVDLYKQPIPDSTTTTKQSISLQQQQDQTTTTNNNNNNPSIENVHCHNDALTTNTMENTKSISWNIDEKQQQVQSQTTTTQVLQQQSVTKVQDDDNKDTSTIHILATRVPVSPHEKSQRIRLGVCAMDKKARSKPMAEILSRLQSECKLKKIYIYFKVILFLEMVRHKKCNTRTKKKREQQVDRTTGTSSTNVSLTIDFF